MIRCVGTTLYNLIKYREKSLLRIGKCSIPEDAIIRAAILGASTILVLVVSAIDQIYNWMDPSIGQFNIVPYVSHALMSTLGTMAFFTWSSTNELIGYNPKFLQPLMKTVQEKMKKMLPHSQNTANNTAASGSEHHSAHGPSGSHAQSSTKEHKDHAKVESVVVSTAPVN